MCYPLIFFYSVLWCLSQKDFSGYSKKERINCDFTGLRLFMKPHDWVCLIKVDLVFMIVGLFKGFYASEA